MCVCNRGGECVCVCVIEGERECVCVYFSQWVMKLVSETYW